MSCPNPSGAAAAGPWIIGAIAAALTLCLGVPVAVIAAPIIRRTIDAGKGSTSPQEALLKFIYTIEPPADAKRLDAEPLIARNQRHTILQQRADYIAAIETTNYAHPDQAAKLAPAYDEQHQDTIDIHNDQATITQYWRAQFDLARPQIGGPLGYDTDALPWTATAHHDRDGWRLTAITMPPWCGTLRNDGTVTGYAKC